MTTARTSPEFIMTHSADSDDWKRLLGGWRDLSEDTHRLVTGLRALPASCPCGTGHAHLAGRCSCCRRDGATRPCLDCLVLMHTVEWKLDAVMDDALRFLEPATETIVGHVGAGMDTSLIRLRNELLQFATAFRAIEASVDVCRAECRLNHLTALKDLGEQLLARVDRVDALVDETALRSTASHPV